MSNSDNLPTVNEAAAAAFGMNRDDDVVEVQPEMRSVAVLQSPPSSTLQFSADIGGPKFGKGLPLGTKPLSVHPKNRSISDTISIKREWNEANWKVSTLDPVPLDFPLERTRREIHNVTATQVADRISNTLRLLSVDAEYDGEKAKVKCKTNDMVSFRIRLFAGDESLQQPVIVEIQRRSGPPSCFMRVCRQILDGAEGMEIEADTVPSRKKMPPCMTKMPVGGLKCIQMVENVRDPHTDAIGSIRKSLELLRSKGMDTNCLGLESLCYMTDPLKTRPDIALLCCKAVISGEHSVEIREEIGVMLQKDVFVPEEFEANSMKELFEKCRHLSLCLLSNVMDLTSKDGSLVDAVKSEEWFEDLIFSLLDEVKGFEGSSNNAYEAARSLTCLATCSDVARRLMLEHSAVEDLHAAYAFGLCNHELLANETERSLKALGHQP
ncbi:hypothetical protein IV203_036385 [Nitzschia inconspicua]|uniref:Uncharacterized protein n=1 Tax=Nitzschia inconspicua TaxID=303405 RepID=A0A9K3PVQ5_9STRA|nr:hypothetical protein IV203_036385 [Nitzschia inconspicua]